MRHFLPRGLHRSRGTAACLALLLAAPVGLAEDSGSEAGPLPPGSRQCVNISRIRNTRIIDDATILFYMQGGNVYVNRLPRRCPGLEIAGSFAYKTSVNSLCDVDIITVIRPGSAVVRGPSCGLGVFQPISEEEIQLLRAEPQPETDNDEVVPEIEPPEGAAAPEQADDGAAAGSGDRD